MVTDHSCCGAPTGLSGRSSCSRWIYRNTIQQEWSSGFRITGSVECTVGQLVTLPWSVDWDSSLDSAQIHPQIIHVVGRNSKCSAALWAEVRDFLPPWLHLSFHLFHNLWSAIRRKCNFRANSFGQTRRRNCFYMFHFPHRSTVNCFTFYISSPSTSKAQWQWSC